MNQISLPKDANRITVIGGTSSADGVTVVAPWVDPNTHRLLVDLASGNVTSVSVVTANGFSGTVANATTTPAITMQTTINAPVLAGNGTALIAATTTGTGSTAVLSVNPVLPQSVTIGSAASHTGTELFKGITSGTVTLSVQDAAGTWTMKLPTTAGTNGQTLITDGSGNTSWSSATGYNLVETNTTPVTQRTTLNFSTLFTVTDNPGNTSTDIDIDVSALATDTTFIDDLIANNYFTTNLANNNNFITTLTNNPTFQGDIVTIINNAGPSLTIDLTTQVTGILPVPNGGTGAATLTGVLVGNATSAITGTAIAQGDLFYGSAVNTLTALPKNTSATRYLSNQGTSNNPSWNQVNLANGVTGTLPLVNGGTGSSLSDPGANKLWGWDDTDNSIGFWTIGSGLSYDHSTHTLSSTGSSASVTNISKFDDFIGGGGNDFTNGSGYAGLGGIGELGWAGIAGPTVGVGDSGSIGPASGETGRPGIIQITSSTGNLAIGLRSSGGGFNNHNPVIPVGFGNTSIGNLNQGNWNVATAVKLSQTTCDHEIGFGGDTTLTGYNNGIYFRFTGGVWDGVCKSSGSITATGSTVAGDTNWHKFEIVMNGAGNSVEFFIDGVSLGTVVSNIPTASDVPFDYTISLANANGDNLKVDYWLFNMTVAAR